MGAVTQVIFATVEKHTCCQKDCGIIYGLEQGFANYRRQDKRTFYCPNGHPQFFPGKTESDLLKEELARQKQRTTWAEANASDAWDKVEKEKHKSRALKGVLTKTKNRISNGVCPCCNRTFTNLLSHMHTQHPDYKTSK